MTHRYFVCVIGSYKLENWRLYRQVVHTNKAGNAKWLAWDCVL
jgi:hypothetical protein